MTDHNKVLADLIALAQALQFALDDSEEIADGRHLVDAEHISNLTAVIERLDALPDDKPGYTMDFPGKANWALRDVFGATLAINELRRQLQASRGSGTPEWLSEALNSGDGSYRP